MVGLTLPRHAWTGTAWRHCPSLDAHAMSVQARWPGAEAQHVRSLPGTGFGFGLVHRVGGRVVAEVRDRTGRQSYEEWIAVPESLPERSEP